MVNKIEDGGGNVPGPPLLEFFPALLLIFFSFVLSSLRLTGQAGPFQTKTDAGPLGNSKEEFYF